MNDVQKHYVLVEVVDAGVGAKESDPWASSIRNDLNAAWRSVREVTFRTAEVTAWLDGEEEEWMKGS